MTYPIVEIQSEHFMDNGQEWRISIESVFGNLRIKAQHGNEVIIPDLCEGESVESLYEWLAGRRESPFE